MRSRSAAHGDINMVDKFAWGDAMKALAVRNEVAALFILRWNGEFEEQATPQFAAYLLPEE